MEINTALPEQMHPSGDRVVFEDSAIPKSRIVSIDAFRGFTILAMIFVIQVAGYTNLPFTMSWFGSPPVSTFHHAAEAAGNTTGIGLTFTDLVAPFFVFIVGMVLPLSKKRRGREWRRHVGNRTFLLIALGVLYISLIFGLSYWWGILQAIGVAYFLGAVSILIPRWQRWILLFAIAAFHLIMSNSFSWWLHLGDPSRPFFTLANLNGDPLRPLTIHCTPWASISYGLITIAGTFLGEAVLTKNASKIIKESILLFIVFCGIGYALHLYSWPHFAMNKETVSVSYSLFTSGVSAITYLIFYLIIDVARYQRWAWALIIFGSNALLGYFLQPVVRILAYSLGFKNYLIGYSGLTGVLVGLIWTAVLWYIVYLFNKRNIFLKI
jgi:predicted acyltransferase